MLLFARLNHSRPISDIAVKFAVYVRLFLPANPLRCLFQAERDWLYPCGWRSILDFRSGDYNQVGV